LSVLIVAKKEFADQISSKRFLALAGIILLITVYTVYQGVQGFYNAYASGMHKPFVSIFGISSSLGFMTFGAFLGLLMGFDLITKEKEEGSLKTLLSHPVYRDSVINGKAIGAFAALGVAIFLVLTISVGILLLYGIYPTLSDVGDVVKFGALTLVYTFTFFAISLFASTIARNSGTALIIAFGFLILFMAVLPILGEIASQFIVGPPPRPPSVPPPAVPVPPPGGEGTQVRIQEGVPAEDEEVKKLWEEYERQSREYWEKKRAISDTFSILSPSNNYLALLSSLGARTFFETKDTTKNLMGFIALPVIFFIMSYIKFLRMDIA
jgi:ABC-2 type transport system permease protein